MPRTQYSGKQIRNQSVQSIDIEEGTIELVDMSPDMITYINNAGGTGGPLPVFNASKASSTGLSRSIATVTGFSAPNVIYEEFTFDQAGGLLTINSGGQYEIGYTATVDQPGTSSRSQAEVFIEKYDGVSSWNIIPELKSEHYSRQRRHGATSSPSKIVDVSAGDRYRVRARRTNGNGTLEIPSSGINLSVKKMVGGVRGEKGERGEGFQVDSSGELSESVISAIEAGPWSSEDVYYYVVTDDNRSNKSVPPPMAGDASLHLVMYDGTEWKDFGQFSGMQGPPGAQGDQGDMGPVGPAGPGVPDGGPIGTVLTKRSSADNDTEWKEIESVSSIFGQSFSEWRSNSAVSVSSTSWFDKIRVTSPVLEAGAKYRVGYTAQHIVDNGIFRSDASEIRFLVDGAELAYDTSSSSRWEASSSHAFITGSGSSVPLVLQYSVTSSSSSTTIRRAGIEFWRVE